MHLDDQYEHINPNYVNAYRICRQQEKGLLAKLDEASTASYAAVLKTQLVHIRILGHLFSVGLPDAAKSHVAKSIVSCKDDQERLEAGKFYLDHFIRQCKFISYLTSSRSCSC
jgi:hypothetical protein